MNRSEAASSGLAMCVIVCLVSVMAAQSIAMQSPATTRPPGVDNSGAVVAPNSIQLFKDKNFENNMVAIGTVTGNNPGQAQELQDGMGDSLTSLRWNLPLGAIVVFYEDEGAKGEHLVIWGQGQISDVDKFDFNDKASRWAWFNIGEMNSSTNPDGTPHRPSTPIGADHPTAPVSVNTLELFKSKNYEANHASIAGVTSRPEGALNQLPQDLPDSLTSLRWNLPPGVLVMLFQDADGTKQQVGIWGEGEIKDLDHWDFNDKASRWAWYNIGDVVPPALGYRPPSATSGDPIDLVAVALVPASGIQVQSTELRAKKNPKGAGTFVYLPRASGDSTKPTLIWLVMDGKAYAVSAQSQPVTPSLLPAASVDNAEWAKTGINKTNAEVAASQIIFVSE